MQMKKDILYITIKNMIGVFVAITIASALELEFATSAGVITMLTLLNTRLKTISMALRRLVGGLGAILIGGGILHLFNFDYIGLIIFIGVMMPLAFYFKIENSIVGNVVLVTHILSLSKFDLDVIINESLILLIGVSIGVLLIVHMPKQEKSLKEGQKVIEDNMKAQLTLMSYSLKNLCFINEDDIVALDEIESKIKYFQKIAQKEFENSIFKKNDFYVRYYSMRLRQLYRLMYMEKHFNQMFITEPEALKLSHMTELVMVDVGELDSLDNIRRILANERVYFKTTPLPEDRLSFESRATLFQYMNDLELFLEIQNKFIEENEEFFESYAQIN